MKAEKRGTRSVERGREGRRKGEDGQNSLNRELTACRASAPRSSLHAPRRLLAIVLSLIMNQAAGAAPFSFDDLQFWIGAGTNRAALVIDWSDTSTTPPALAWGYRWDGTASGRDMLTAVIAADPRLFAKLGDSAANPRRVYGLGYDANNDEQFAIDDGTVFDTNGVEYTSSPPDLAASITPTDYYAEGWYTGFWHYGFTEFEPYGSGHWSDAGSGMASHTLVNGEWNSWVFTPTFDFASFAMNPTAAPAPFPPGDYTLDGYVTTDDYGVWMSSLGSTTQLSADGDHNSIIDAADYVVWRNHFITTANAAFTANAPEPTTASLILIALTCFIFRKNLWNTNHR